MREEIFVFLLAVSVSVCGNNYYGKLDGWNPDGWDGVGFGREYSVDHYDEDKFGEFWGRSGDWKRSDDKEKEKTDDKDDKKDDEKPNEERECCYNPCNNENEDCMRNYLSTNGHCVPMYKYSNKEKINRERAVLYLPKFNLTIIVTDSQIEGLDGKVDKFYINKETGNLIFSVNFKTITVDSKLSYFEFHRQGEEPIRAADYAIITYAPTVLTAVIPFSFYGLSMKQTRVAAFTNGNPTFEFGPKVTHNPDPVIQITLASYTADISIAVQEALLTEAYNFFISYLQNYICDFGIKI